MNSKREQECQEAVGWCKSEQYPNLNTAKFLQTQQQESEKDTVSAQGMFTGAFKKEH